MILTTNGLSVGTVNPTHYPGHCNVCGAYWYASTMFPSCPVEPKGHRSTTSGCTPYIFANIARLRAARGTFTFRARTFPALGQEHTVLTANFLNRYRTLRRPGKGTSGGSPILIARRLRALRRSA